MFTLAEVTIKKLSIFPSKFGNDSEKKNFAVTMECEGDSSLNDGKTTSLIGGIAENSAQVNKFEISFQKLYLPISS